MDTDIPASPPLALTSPLPSPLPPATDIITPLNHDFIVGQSVECVRTLFDKYKHDVYMTSRLYKIVSSQFPAMLENIDKMQAMRQERVTALVVERDAFVDAFLENCKYFFCEKTDRFFYYDGNHYTLYNEDDILHHILSGISNRSSILMNWKRRTKTYVMQRIKTSNILTSVPESITIQRVMAMLTPMLFASRAEAKYFLTVMGDSIHRKPTSAVHLVSIHAKPFIMALNQISLYMFGTNINTSFKYKYHDHDYTQCRIVNINDNVRISGLWSTEYALDMLCVAAHYSSRYDTAESYLLEFSPMEDDVLQRTVCFLKDRTKENIVNSFVEAYVKDSPAAAPGGISWKNIQYLWKHFLRAQGLPSIIFQQSFKEILVGIERLRYSPETDEFMGVFSDYLPGVNAFVRFWNETTVADDDESDLEVEEVAILLKRWCATQSGMSTQFVTTRTILDILGHYFPGVDITDGKYIHGVRSLLWDKKEDIRGAIVSMMSEESIPSSAYVYYCMYCKNHNTNKKMVVSKAYFERYLSEDGFTHIS